MEKKILDDYLKAGKVLSEVREFAKKQVKEEVKALDLAEKIEKMVREKECELAFPVNISLNDITAHYTPDIDDPLTLKGGDLVKVDIGIQINGHIADGAFSVCLGEKSNPLIVAAEDALEAVLKQMRPGKTVEELSGLVEETVVSHGVNPVRNLAGHTMEEYTQHGSVSIPGGKVPSKDELKEDMVFGMEVFTTNGEGMVKESSPVLIYGFLQPKPVRLLESRKIMEKIAMDFKTLPFAKRWLKDVGSPFRLQMALREMVDRKVLREYPPLRERTFNQTAQAEETVIVSDKPIITTR